MRLAAAFPLILLLLALGVLMGVPRGTVPRVHAPLGDFSVSASPSQLSMAQGATSIPTITVTAEGGYQGNVTLMLAETFDSIDIKVQFTPQVLEFNSTHQTVSSVARILVLQQTLPGSYTINVEAYDGNIQHSSQISLIVTGEDFTISASPSKVDFPLAKNETLGTRVTVTSIGGFSGTVSITVSVESGYPPLPLPSASPSTNVVTITPLASASFPLAITVNSSIVAHQYGVRVVGMGATTTGFPRSVEFPAVVGPDFNMSMVTRNLVVHQGSTVSANLTFTSIDGYSGTIAAYSGLIGVNPPNPGIALYPPGAVSLLPGGTNISLIVVKTDSRTGLGTYHVGIEATDDISGGHLGEFLPYTVTVLGPSAGPDFTMYADPSQISASLGATVNSTINLIGVSGYSGPVHLYSSTGAILDPASLTLSSTTNASSIFSLTLPGPTPGGGGPGWWFSSGIGTVMITAADPAGLTHEGSINITATPFSFAASLTRQQVLANSTSIISLAVGAIGGFNGTVSLTAASSPGIVATVDYYHVLDFSVLPSLFNSRLEIRVPAGTSDGDYLVQVTATYLRPEYLPFSTAPKQPLTYTLPVHVIVTSPTSPPTTILGLQPIEFYAIVAGLSATAAISVTYFVLQRKTIEGTRVPG